GRSRCAVSKTTAGGPTPWKLDKLAASVGEFVRHVVPQGPTAPAVKAVKEATEFAAEPSLEEAADVLICLLGWTELNDIPPGDLIEAALGKMQTNLARTWRQEPDGTWQHI